MPLHQFTFGLIALGLISCSTPATESHSKDTASYPDIQVVGTMKRVMWNGELDSRIDLDTLANKNGLYGLGPQMGLKGELMINDGICYLSKVTADSSITVEKGYAVSAPFFVYAHVNKWEEEELPANIKSIQAIEIYLEQQTKAMKRPFAFKLVGKIKKAVIHIQNLPTGSKVSSPEEAHQGQVDYRLENENAEIIGFFSTNHQGVFTHHDSYVHMHLITADKSKMGHLDEIEIDSMKLFLPKE
jgi:acetolactate decarboxylase